MIFYYIVSQTGAVPVTVVTIAVKRAEQHSKTFSFSTDYVAPVTRCPGCHQFLL